MVNIPTNRPPTTPGEMLREEFLEPMGLTQKQLANDIGVSYQRVNELINNKRGITPSTALRLGKYFGTSPDFWLNLQRANDLYAVLKKEQNEIDKIKPFSLFTER
ncbi:HigA family addiction module antitoxin [Crocosphaera watsonii WH 8501]|uniref:Helix-turn-helix motif n=2 Tax=Crocosphaera watsonii TaxID=263511 RepID=Q4BUA2_CROWT|nr:HigA family addiction module antitoxin [Crocosphaera watsonii]EAM47483.1 Helix-turn-helix motif [Crocosphaera watsonii WH 8501]CCQ49149.1 HigA protein (antitoxin to HigB) [Crocosphaera watsonii WH 8502]